MAEKLATCETQALVINFGSSPSLVDILLVLCCRAMTTIPAGLICLHSVLAVFSGRGSMNGSQSNVFSLVYISWGVITLVLVVLLSYRATLLRSDDQMSMDPAGVDHLQLQQTILARRSLLMGEIIVLSVISSVLLLTCLSCSIYWGFTSF